MVKNLPAMQETWVQSLGCEDPLEVVMASHSSILAWRNPVGGGARSATVREVTKSCTQSDQVHTATPRQTTPAQLLRWPSVQCVFNSCLVIALLQYPQMFCSQSLQSAPWFYPPCHCLWKVLFFPPSYFSDSLLIHLPDSGFTSSHTILHVAMSFTS